MQHVLEQVAGSQGGQGKKQVACVCVGGGATEGGDRDKSQHPYILF